MSTAPPGRHDLAHLNWEAPHVFGRREEKALNPIVVVVNDRSEEDVYRGHHPDCLQARPSAEIENASRLKRSAAHSFVGMSSSSWDTPGSSSLT